MRLVGEQSPLNPVLYGVWLQYGGAASDTMLAVNHANVD